jgi:tRNA 2-thiouridine synthesizing protein D
MSVKIAIAVYGAPYSSQASASALRFAEAAVAMGHSIVRVFFYHDAVHVANDFVVAPQDEVDVAASWAELAKRSGVELAICIAASLKRGVVDAAEATRHEKAAGDLRAPFRIVGLGQLIEAVGDADRVVTFAA